MTVEDEKNQRRLDAIQRASSLLTWLSLPMARRHALDIQKKHGVGSKEDLTAAQGAKNMRDVLAAGQRPR